mgnify:FL=1
MQICTDILTTWNVTNLLSTFTRRPRWISLHLNLKMKYEASHFGHIAFPCSEEMICHLLHILHMYTCVILLSDYVLYEAWNHWFTPRVLFNIGMSFHVHMYDHRPTYTCMYTNMLHAFSWPMHIPTKMYSSKLALQNVEQMSQPRTILG